MAKIFFHKHANQFAVCLSVNGVRKTFYLGTDKESAEVKYHSLMVDYKNRHNYQVHKQILFSDLVCKYLEAIKTDVALTT
ncbi:MAG: hypothetical protein E3K32_05470 [wastewater metagenome]|nr:hypothetical protein [Candidatus Loosdrechtia aerotolerans]